MNKKELQQKIADLHNQKYSFDYYAQIEDDHAEIERLEKEIKYLEDREKNEKNALLQKKDPLRRFIRRA